VRPQKKGVKRLFIRFHPEKQFFLFFSIFASRGSFRLEKYEYFMEKFSFSNYCNWISAMPGRHYK